MNKKMLFAAAFVALALGQLAAQTNDTVHYLIRPAKAKINYLGFYVAPEFQYGQSAGAFTTFSGGSAGLIFNKRFSIGVAAAASMDESFSPSKVAPLVLRSEFGGLKLGYTIRPDAAVHVNLSLLAGGGMAEADSARTSSTDYFEGPHGHDGGKNGLRGNEFYLVQPGLELEANLLRPVKLFVGANYRIAGKMNSSTTSTAPSDALQGFSASAGVKVGLFDWKVKPIRFKKRSHKKG